MSVKPNGIDTHSNKWTLKRSLTKKIWSVIIKIGGFRNDFRFFSAKIQRIFISPLWDFGTEKTKIVPKSSNFDLQIFLSGSV